MPIRSDERSDRPAAVLANRVRDAKNFEEEAFFPGKSLFQRTRRRSHA
jgi:hypothetical protein